MPVELMEHQKMALESLSNGKVLWGGVGTGKSITALSYYMEKELIGDIYIITTAKKRDSLEWERDAAKLGIGTDHGATLAGVIRIDSWNNIGKYTDVEGAFFIFDEQRLVGSGAWVKSFYKIAKRNAWIVLSATPGDTWIDYIPLFVANGYYKNATEFKREHVVYSRFSRYPRIEKYVGVKKLERIKKEILVEMPYMYHTTRIHEDVEVTYDKVLFEKARKNRWNVFEDKPCRDGAELFAVLRRLTWGDRSRLDAVRSLMEKHNRLIVFYNYNYELELLRELNDTWTDMYQVREWNGQKKQEIPETGRWVYLVQYTSGSEGWNCTSTDAMIFFSLPYSFRKFEQSQGRIDRLNTFYDTLYYFSMFSGNPIDQAVRRSLKSKKAFNEHAWIVENLGEFKNEKKNEEK
jgi:hypothetical protein